MTDPLRPLWDFDDLDATEARFRALRAEVLTQLARVQGLREDYAAGDRLLDEVDEADPRVRIRVDLERGRLRRSSGDTAAALPLFERAFDAAAAAGEDWLAGDAAHMAALAAPNREVYLAWTQRGIELAQSSDDARYWLGPLLNNLGGEHFEAGEHAEALDAFERALAAREQDPANPESIAHARYALGKALRALGRPDEAVRQLGQAVAWAASAGAPDGWYHEELAEDYAAVGRETDAAEQARLALPLLEEADPSFEEDAERAARLRELTRS